MKKKIKYSDEDIKLGQGAGVRGTPTFFVNGKKVVGAKPLSEFQKVIGPVKGYAERCQDDRGGDEFSNFHHEDSRDK